MWHGGPKGPYAWASMFSRTLVLCALSCATWFGLAMVNCTSGTTPDCEGGESGCGPGYDGPPPEGALSETSSPTDGATDAPIDVSPDVTPEAAADAPSGDAAFGCHASSGMGATLQCTYEALPSSSCTGGQKAGPCPPKGLRGCCEVTTDGGTLTAVCYYAMDVPDAAIEMGLCTTAGGTWVTTAP
jgi:hypothetical protein